MFVEAYLHGRYVTVDRVERDEILVEVVMSSAPRGLLPALIPKGLSVYLLSLALIETRISGPRASHLSIHCDKRGRISSRRDRGPSFIRHGTRDSVWDII